MISPSTVPMRPPRDVTLRYLRFFDAVRAGLAGTVAFLIVYYLTLGLLPGVFSHPLPSAFFPFKAWAYRFDLAQFLGALVYPPYPTAFTWCLGIVLIFGTLVGLAVAYALVLSWGLQRSDVVKGIGFGIVNGIGLLVGISMANGMHPAIMRNVMMDPGYGMFGWSFWAPFQLLLAHAVYGGVLGKVYSRR